MIIFASELLEELKDESIKILVSGLTNIAGKASAPFNHAG